MKVLHKSGSEKQIKLRALSVTSGGAELSCMLKMLQKLADQSIT